MVQFTAKKNNNFSGWRTWNIISKFRTTNKRRSEFQGNNPSFILFPIELCTNVITIIEFHQNLYYVTTKT